MFEEGSSGDPDKAIMDDFKINNAKLIKKINFTRGKPMFELTIIKYEKLFIDTFNKLQKDESIAYIIIQLIVVLGEDIEIQQVKLIINLLILKMVSNNIYNRLKIIFNGNRDIFNKIIIILLKDDIYKIFYNIIIPLGVQRHIYIAGTDINDNILYNCINNAICVIAYEDIWILLYFTFKLYDEIFKQFKDYIQQYMLSSGRNLHYELLDDNYSNFLIMAILSKNINNVRYIIDNFPDQYSTLIILPDTYGFNAIDWAAYGSSNIHIFNLIYSGRRIRSIEEVFKLPLNIEDSDPNSLFIGSIVEFKSFSDECKDIFEKIKIIFKLMIEESDSRYRYSNNMAFICLNKKSDYFEIGLLSDIIFEEIKKYININNNYAFYNQDAYDEYFKFINKIPILGTIDMNDLKIYRPMKIYNMQYITKLDVQNSNAYYIHAHGSQSNMDNFINLRDNVYIIMTCKPFADVVYNYINELYNFYLNSKNKLSFIRAITSINIYGNRFCIFEKKCLNISLSFTGQTADNAIDVVNSISYGIYDLPITFNLELTRSTKELLIDTYKNVSSSERSKEEKTIAEKQIADLLKSNYNIISFNIQNAEELDSIDDLNTLLENIIYPRIRNPTSPCIILLNMCRS